MPIKIQIHSRNAENIRKVLERVNDNAIMHTVSTYAMVEAVAREVIEKFCDKNLTLNMRAGAQVTFRPAGALAKAYKNPYITTKITLMVGSDGKKIFLVGVERAKAWPRQSRLFEIALTGASHLEYVQKRSEDFKVRKSIDFDVPE